MSSAAASGQITRTRKDDMPRSIWLSAPMEMPALRGQLGERQFALEPQGAHAPADAHIGVVLRLLGQFIQHCSLRSIDVRRRAALVSHGRV